MIEPTDRGNNIYYFPTEDHEEFVSSLSKFLTKNENLEVASVVPRSGTPSGLLFPRVVGYTVIFRQKAK